MNKWFKISISFFLVAIISYLLSILYFNKYEISYKLIDFLISRGLYILTFNLGCLFILLGLIDSKLVTLGKLFTLIYVIFLGGIFSISFFISIFLYPGDRVNVVTYTNSKKPNEKLIFQFQYNWITEKNKTWRFILTEQENRKIRKIQLVESNILKHIIKDYDIINKKYEPTFLPEYESEDLTVDDLNIKPDYFPFKVNVDGLIFIKHMPTQK